MDLTEIRVFEEQKIGTLKLSEAIRIGATLVRESQTFLRVNPPCGCALGGAAVATGHSLVWVSDLEFHNHLRTHFPGVPDKVFCDISGHHYSGGMTREQCADYAESLGF